MKQTEFNHWYEIAEYLQGREIFVSRERDGKVDFEDNGIVRALAKTTANMYNIYFERFEEKANIRHYTFPDAWVKVLANKKKNSWWIGPNNTLIVEIH